MILARIYYRIVNHIYSRTNWRPGTRSIFYSEVLAKEAKWMRGF